MLPRILEPEVMDTAADAADYDAMDFTAVNAAFADDCLNAIGRVTTLLDVGTGTARIPIELAKRSSSLQIIGVDLSEEMLILGRKNIAAAGFADRITLFHVDAKGMPFEDGTFDAVVSNSIVHHIPDPNHCFKEIVRLAKPGGAIFIRDLFRPKDKFTLDQIVETYAGNDTPRQRKLFADSLHAALTVDEVRSIVALFGFDPATVSATSDRHWTWAAKKPT
jgi:ubiquinone/menaquinone biosynthesis C-methylase UbiE